MKSDVLCEVEAFADKILRSYFCDSEVDFLISTFAPDIVWMGGGEKMKAEGREEVAAFFQKGKNDLIPCDMFDEQYVTRDLGGGCYLCEGDNWLQTKSDTQTYFKKHQRVTFIFRRVGETFETLHIHNSLSYDGVKDDELFPVQEAKETYQKLQDVLHQRERQIELMLSQLPGGMQTCRLDEDYTIKWTSDGLCKMFGCSNQEELAEYTNNSCKGFVFEEDIEQVFARLQMLEIGEGYNIEYRVCCKDGKILWVADFGKRVYDLDGEEVINCFISDITDRKAQEMEIVQVNEEVQRQASFLSKLYNTMPCGILQFSTDSSHQIVSINRMAWEFYGFHSEAEYRKEIINPFQLILDQDLKKIQEIMDNLRLDGESVTYTRECRRKDGSSVWISVIIQRLINADGQEVIQAVFNDITEMHMLQMVQEQERLIENRSLRAAICTSYPLIMSVNLTKDTYNCFIEEQSIYALKYRQGSVDQILADTLPNIYPTYREEFETKWNRREIMNRFAHGDREIFMEVYVKGLGLDEDYHWISIQLIYVDNPVGSDMLAIALMKSLDSVRAEKARQEQLLRDALASTRAANSAKSDFLSRMSHDIRTPMNAIMGMSAIGQMKLKDPLRVQDCFRKIDASSRYLLALINDILDMSKIETGKMTITQESFDLAELIGEVNTIIFPQTLEREIQYEVQFQEPLERCYIGDALRLKQILMNLLSNALKFTPKGKSIVIEILEQRRTNGFAYLCFMVKDTGVGMSEEFMQRIFLPFEQESSDQARNNVGSGLGLSIVYNLVQLMNGTIDVKSKKGEGTAFTISLPFGLLQDNEAKELQRKSKELLKGIEVLVVDDDAMVGEQTAEIMAEVGAHSVWVDSGAKAIELIRSGLEQGKLYDVAMIDWRMPEMDGIETTRRIRALVGPDTTVIIISAYDWSSIEAEAKAAGASYFISKPLFRSTIYNTLLHMEFGASTAHPQATLPAIPNRHILLAEDNGLNMEIGKSLLEMYGFEVDTAENGQIAVEKFYAMPSYYYGAILMDIRMPVMDGLAATCAIRASGRKDGEKIPILAMTANAFEEDREIALKAGMTSYLVKPLDIHQLIQELEHWMTTMDRYSPDDGQ